MTKAEQIIYNALIDEFVDDETKQLDETIRGISKSGFHKMLTQNYKTYQVEALDISEAEKQKLVALNYLDEDTYEQLKIEFITCYAKA